MVRTQAQAASRWHRPLIARLKPSRYTSKWNVLAAAAERQTLVIGEVRRERRYSAGREIEGGQLRGPDALCRSRQPCQIARRREHDAPAVAQPGRGRNNRETTPCWCCRTRKCRPAAARRRATTSIAATTARSASRRRMAGRTRRVRLRAESRRRRRQGPRRARRRRHD